MNLKRVPWDLLAALLLGLGLGLLYAWVLSPLQVVDSAPQALRSDFKDQYRAVIAAAYSANRDLPRASARLALLGDTDSREALSVQAQGMLAAGESQKTIQQIIDLASALQGNLPAMTITMTLPAALDTAAPPAATNGPVDVSTPFDTETPLPFHTATPRPTRTPIPPPGAPFESVAQENICDESLPEGLLQVITMTVARRQLPGIELILSWSGGEEHFFTGFKPELGNGYADALMSPAVIYTLRAAEGGSPISGLTPPVCQRENGETYYGGLRILLQRP